jgi:hypothetical protein
MYHSLTRCTMYDTRCTIYDVRHGLLFMVVLCDEPFVILFYDTNCIRISGSKKRSAINNQEQNSELWFSVCLMKILSIISLSFLLSSLLSSPLLFHLIILLSLMCNKKEYHGWPFVSIGEDKERIGEMK